MSQNRNFRLCDEIHFARDATFGMMRQRYVEERQYDSEDENNNSNFSSNSGYGGGYSSSSKKRQTRRRSEQRQIEKHQLVKVVQRESGNQHDEWLLVEVLITGERIEIPTNLFKVRQRERE